MKKFIINMKQNIFLKKADFNFENKLSGGIYEASSIYFDKNNNEKQYMKIVFISKQNFYEVIQQLNQLNYKNSQFKIMSDFSIQIVIKKFKIYHIINLVVFFKLRYKIFILFLVNKIILFRVIIFYLENFY